MSVCVLVLCVHASFSLVCQAQQRKETKTERERERERRRELAKEQQLQRAQGEEKQQAGTAYSCASSIRNFTHYAVPTSAGPDRSKATPKQKKNKKKK